jgi:nitroreductase
MNLQDAIRDRRSIRKFLPDPVNEADLKEIIEAGILAPNAENHQAWRFVAVTDKSLIARVGESVSARVDSIVNGCRALGKGDEFAHHKYFTVFFRDAPAIIAVFTIQVPNAIDRALEIMGMELKTPFPILPDQLSIGAAIQNISLVAHEKGYGTTCMFAPVLAHREIGELLGVSAPWVLTALLPIGIPAQKPNARPRKPLDEVYTLIR